MTNVKVTRTCAGCYKMTANGESLWVERSMDEPKYWRVSNYPNYFGSFAEAKAYAAAELTRD